MLIVAVQDAIRYPFTMWRQLGEASGCFGYLICAVRVECGPRLASFAMCEYEGSIGLGHCSRAAVATGIASHIAVA